MSDQEKVWEDRRIRKNGHGGYQVNIPRSWLETMKMDAGEVFRIRIVFQIKDGKPQIEAWLP